MEYVVNGDGGARVSATRSEVTAYIHHPGHVRSSPSGQHPTIPSTPISLPNLTASRSSSRPCPFNSYSEALVGDVTSSLITLPQTWVHISYPS